MTDITENVITALVNRVKSQVTQVINRVYFEPPQKTIFPFINFNFTVESLPIKDIEALNFVVTFNVFAQRGENGALVEATRIAKSIYDALELYDLPLSVGNCYSCRYDGFSTAFTVEDGRTVNHVSRFKILTTN
jgi:hypothetical protein